MSQLYHVHLLPIADGYAVHVGTCECKERASGPAISSPYPATSLSRAVTQLYREAGVTAPDRFVRRACATDLPMHDNIPRGWAETTENLVLLAAGQIWEDASASINESRQRVAELEEHSRSDSPPPIPWFRQALAQVARAKYYALCVKGIQEKPRNNELAKAEDIVAMTDAAIREATAVVLGLEGDQAETNGARYFLRRTRRTMAPLHAHRALRDDIAHAALVAARAVASPGARTEQPVGNSMSGGQADTVVQAATVQGGISTGSHTVVNAPAGPVNTGDGAQIVTTYSGTINQHVGQGHAVIGDVHGGLTFNAGDQS
ncbi:hypothetical protein ACGFX7_06325 [Streptomyces harbinensis]|uniref:hypothetical protein n=1 Tax=Streptomyces harbinensis TaxID=1176198 RepID=UPI00371F866D